MTIAVDWDVKQKNKQTDKTKISLTLKGTDRRTSHVYRGSYMSVHVLLNFLNELRKSDKISGLPSILLLICKESP